MTSAAVYDPDPELKRPAFSDAEYVRRDATTRDVMRASGVDALVLYGTPGLDSEIQYLSGFRVTREAMLIYPLDGSPALYVEYFNHTPHARRVVTRADVRWGGDDLAATVAADLRERGLAAARLGYAGMLPVQRYLRLRQALPEAELVDISGGLRQLRLVKSAEELAFLREGARLTDRAATALAEQARPGLTERDLIAIIEGAYLSAGGQTAIHYLASTPMAEPERCVPAQQPSGRVIRAGDAIITELSAQYQGYSGQILRPYAIGAAPTPAYQRMYDVAVEAFERIAGVIKAGASTEDALDAAELIHAAGYTICDDLLHGYGGGYLPPILRTRRTSATLPPPFTFEENMTIVIQPNVITEDERSGVQVGELVRVTRDGVERMHTYPMRFTRCG
jgi:Xaa-Pro aminopeptidase